MARMSKMDYQLHCRMQEMFCPNVSRHQAKTEYKEMMGNKATHNRTIGIHSYKTYDAYKQTSIEFVRYMRNEHKDIKDINQIKENHVIDYLRYRQDNEKSAYTISKDMAALNKLFNFYKKKKMPEYNKELISILQEVVNHVKTTASIIQTIIKIKYFSLRQAVVEEKAY
jgi:site-specific recombinase XerD